MIIVLCKDYAQAQYAYDIFVGFIEENEPWHEVMHDDYGLTISTDDDLRYVFINRRYLDMIDCPDADILDAEEFFEGIESFYYFE